MCKMGNIPCIVIYFPFSTAYLGYFDDISLFFEKFNVMSNSCIVGHCILLYKMVLISLKNTIVKRVYYSAA